MYQPVRLQSGDLVCINHSLTSFEKTYGILFFLKKQPFLLMPDGIIEKDFSLESLEWVCHTALVHGSYFHSLEQIRQDFASGTFNHVISSIPRASINNTDY
jgi:hypothetical protein